MTDQYQEKAGQVVDSVDRGIFLASELIDAIATALRTTAEAAREEGRRAGMEEAAGWQPIETAPRDGAEILLCVRAEPNRAARYGVGMVDALGIKWDWPWSFPPTHWRPLPAPPTDRVT